MLHVGANFWAIHHGYGLPLLDITETRLELVEEVHTPMRRCFDLTERPLGIICKPDLLHCFRWLDQSLDRFLH